ncbi:FAD-binding protein [Anabaena sp. CCY 9910]|uniref:FAD-binding protein n=1 Tax=Anabaena sp. CCY 9910 TaxID=3103870 RepID=UPI0039E062D4
MSEQKIDAQGVNVIQDQSLVSSVITDFGNLIKGNTLGIIQPHNIEEISSAIEFAKQQNSRLKARGKGYTQSGQSVAQDAFTLDLTRLNHVSKVDTVTQAIATEAGATWQDIVTTTMKFGMLPCVLPLNLEQTVGGLLSTGGIGSTSKTYGPVVANVIDLHIITGNGEHIQCSRTQAPELYHAVLGGLGGCGIIASATLALRKTKKYIRTFHLLYDSLKAWMDDHVLLSRNHQIEHLEGFCWTSAKGIRQTTNGKSFFAHWLYGLQVGIEYDEVAPSVSDVLQNLNYWQLFHTEDEETVSHVFRYQPRFEVMRASGGWNQAHPWIECFISAEALTEILPEILDMLPLSLGDGHRAIMVASDNLPSLFMMPPAKNILCFAILPMAVPVGDTKTFDVLAKVNQLLLSAGGKRYLSGWLGKSDFDWQQHYGTSYETWETMKQRYDPSHILG